MTVEAYPLAHDFPGESTAFLINSNGNYILFAGDTGPDQVEGVDRLSIVWKRIAPLIRNGSFKGIFMEISYTSDQSDNLLFGHLTPYWMMTEMRNLAELVDPVNPQNALEGLRVVVIHNKPTLTDAISVRHSITKELEQQNDLGIDFIIPFQGHRIDF